MKNIFYGEVARPIVIAVHPGHFHADEVFAVATIKKYIKIINSNIVGFGIEVIRTRSKKRLASADYRIDVGRKYDPETGDFDHHQGLESRENGVRYASFGLVWKACGLKICNGNTEVAKFIEEKLVYFIDEQDNGARATLEGAGSINVFTVSSLIGIHNPGWDKDESPDQAFNQMVILAQNIIYRLIRHAKSVMKAKAILREAIDKAENASYIVLEEGFPWKKIIYELAEFIPETLLFIIYRHKIGDWQVISISDELARITGVATAVSYRKESLLHSILENREDAIRLVQLAIKS